MASSLCVSVSTPLSPLHPFCICVQIFPVPLSKPVTGSGPPNPALPHFPLVTSAKTPFPNKFAFTRFHPVQSFTQFSPEGSGTFQESELLECRSEDFLISCISFQAYWVLSGTMGPFYHTKFGEISPPLTTVPGLCTSLVSRDGSRPH